MLSLEKFKNTPMGVALLELADEMKKKQMPPVELNVIGGFALMLRGIRSPDGVTDVDYVGMDLSESFAELSRRIGLKHGMESGWINNDGMLTGDSIEAFELSTGKLHFNHVFTVGDITINVLDERDLLRLKVISVDTAMAELEANGSFARTKDFEDVRALMRSQKVRPEQLEAEFGEYMICKPNTERLLTKIYVDGPEKASEAIDQYVSSMRKKKMYRKSETQSAYMKNLMKNLMKQSDGMVSADSGNSVSDQDSDSSNS